MSLPPRNRVSQSSGKRAVILSLLSHFYESVWNILLTRKSYPYHSPAWFFSTDISACSWSELKSLYLRRATSQSPVSPWMPDFSPLEWKAITASTALWCFGVFVHSVPCLKCSPSPEGAPPDSWRLCPNNSGSQEASLEPQDHGCFSFYVPQSWCTFMKGLSGFYYSLFLMDLSCLKHSRGSVIHVWIIRM